MSYLHETLIEISLENLALSIVPLLLLAYSSWHLDIGIHNALLIATIRSFIQLTILSLILETIFEEGTRYWGIVFGYVLFMITLAAYESTSRSKYYFEHMFWYVMVNILINVAITSLFSFGLIIHLEPIWDPQYVIPIIGVSERTHK